MLADTTIEEFSIFDMSVRRVEMSNVRIGNGVVFHAGRMQGRELHPGWEAGFTLNIEAHDLWDEVGC